MPRKQTRPATTHEQTAQQQAEQQQAASTTHDPTEAPNTTTENQTHDRPTTEPLEAVRTTEPTTAIPTTPLKPQRSLSYTVTIRLQQEGRWAEAEPVRDELMRHARKSMKLTGDEAREWAYTELNRRFPAPAQDEIRAGDSARDIAGDNSPLTTGEAAIAYPRTRDANAVHGLNLLPASWPILPANAPLPVEIQWVQSNRLSVVSETMEGTTVDLSRSLSPAPSYAALGWLETSIRAYAKYCEIAAKATQAATDETAVVRREKQSIQQIRDLLAEMLEDGDID